MWDLRNGIDPFPTCSFQFISPTSLFQRYMNRNFFMIIWHCRSQLKNVHSSGIWSRTFRIPVRRSTCWAIESTGIGGKFLSMLSTRDILATTYPWEDMQCFDSISESSSEMHEQKFFMIILSTISFIREEKTLVFMTEIARVPIWFLVRFPTRYIVAWFFMSSASYCDTLYGITY